MQISIGAFQGHQRNDQSSSLPCMKYHACKHHRLYQPWRPYTFVLYYSDVLDIRVHFWGGKFSQLHNSNLTCKKAPISTDSHSKAAYVFLRWVLIVSYSSQICHFHEIMQLPTLRNSRFCSYSHSLPCVRKTQDAQILRCVCVLTLCRQDTVTNNSCVLHLASCTRMYTRTHSSRQHCEKTIKTGIF